MPPLACFALAHRSCSVALGGGHAERVSSEKFEFATSGGGVHHDCF